MTPTLSDSPGAVRFWYYSKTAPTTDKLLPVLHTANAPVPVYDGGSHRGEYAPIVTGLRDALRRLQRSTLTLAAGTAEARQQQLLGALLGLTNSARQRVQVLRQLGHFRFRRDQSAEVRQQRLQEAVADHRDIDLASQAQLLGAIWRPTPTSFLDAMLQRPAEIGRLLSRRMDAEADRPLAIICHRFDDLADDGHQTFVRAGAVAYQQGSVIHLLGGVGEHLHQTDDGNHNLSSLQALLLHEVVEVMLAETTDLGDLASHIVATTAEHCIAGDRLVAAVESFFIEWDTRRLALTATVATAQDAEDPMEAWHNCQVTHDELRPEAFVIHTMAEQRQILREMFGDDWTDQDEAEMTTAPVATT